MYRILPLAMTFSFALALPAMAADAKIKVDPGTGPTSTMTEQVPQMKSDTDGAKPLPSAKVVSDAVPSIRPGDAMSGQSDNKSSAAIGAKSASLPLTMSEGESWIKKPVYSNDGKKIGSVVSFQRDAANNVIGMHADVGGYFGFGASRVSLTPSQFKLKGDRVELDLTAAEVKALPVIHI